MAKELSPLEIIKAANDVKKQIKNFDKRKMSYKIYVVRIAYVTEEPLLVCIGSNFQKGSDEIVSCYDEFCNQLDELVNDTDVALINIEMYSANNKELVKVTIPIRSKMYEQEVLFALINNCLLIIAHRKNHH